MDAVQTSYDKVQYPSAVHRTTQPDHLAALARLHGLDAADPRKARVLDIAGSDGINVFAMAAAYPEGQYLNIDLAPSAIARGNAMRAASGLDMVRVERADILEAADAIEGEFDYVIAHGIYAWAPPAVQEAILRLTARVLSPEGMAHISYNAKPGGHFRKAIRDMILFETKYITDPQEKLDRAFDFLRSFAEPQESDEGNEPLRAMRRIAEVTAGKAPETLFHDEGGDCFDPKSLTEVAEAAAKHGLAFLNDAQGGYVLDGLPGEDLSDEAVIRKAQARDYANIAFFHHSVFIREGRSPRRRLDPADMAMLHGSVSRELKRTGKQEFKLDDDDFVVEDEAMANFLGDLIQRIPLRLPLAPVADTPERVEALFAMLQKKILILHATPYPGTLAPGDMPLASPLARAQAAVGEIRLCTLDHRVVEIPQDGPRLFLQLLDGTRDRAAIAARCNADGLPSPELLDTALRQMAAAGLMLE